MEKGGEDTMQCLAAALFFLLGASTLQAERPLTPAEASKHVGETQEVCGVVTDARYDPGQADGATYLYLDESDAKQGFTFVLFGDDRRDLKDYRVCGTGLIVRFDDRVGVIKPGSFLPAIGVPGW